MDNIISYEQFMDKKKYQFIYTRKKPVNNNIIYLGNRNFIKDKFEKDIELLLKDMDKIEL